MKALILAPFSKIVLDRLRSSVEAAHESWMDTKQLLSPEELIDRIQEQDIDILVIEANFITREVFEKATKLKLLGVCRADLNLVDMQAATENGVPVVNTPARNNVAVAELAIGLMLSLLRKIPAAHNMVRLREWVDPTAAYDSLRGSELTGKTIGIVGFGAIGQQVAKRVCAFDTYILVFDPYVAPEKVREMGAEHCGLDELMKRSDLVTLHCPVSPETVGLINSQRIALMKPAAFLINTASSFVIDGDAIIQALRDKRIAGAAFDVFETWPVKADSPLLDLDNVVLTPHIGGATYETIERHSQIIADDIEMFLRGERPKNLVNPQVWGQNV